MIKTIYAKLESWSPAVFVGWNSLKFDEELLRQAFYQTLHFPYLTNARQNCRTDAMRIARVVSIMEPGAINVPINEEGKPSFRLVDIAAANGYNWQNAHDAVDDANATLFMCQLMERNAPDTWSYAMQFSQKQAVSTFIEEGDMFALIPAGFNDVAPKMVQPIGRSQKDRNAYYVFDLSYEIEDLQSLHGPDLLSTLKWPHTAVLPVKTNRAPMLHYPEDVSDEFLPNGLSVAHFEEKGQVLQMDKALCERLVAAMEEMALPNVTSMFVEREIYNGLISYENWNIARAFHNSDWQQRLTFLRQFQDVRLRKLAARLMFEEASHLLNENMLRDARNALSSRLNGQINENKRPRTFDEAVAEASLLQVSEPQNHGFLEEVINFLEQRKMALSSG